MSKSLGNFKTIRDELQAYSGEVIRYFLISSQYRSQVEYSPESLAEAQSGLDRFYQSMRGLEIDELSRSQLDAEYMARFECAMCDDFNSPEALAVMFDLAKALNVARQSGEEKSVHRLASTLKALGDVLGVLKLDPEQYFKGIAAEDGLSDEDIDAMILARTQARADKDWAESDRIRDVLTDQGIILDDSKSGTTWRRV